LIKTLHTHQWGITDGICEGQKRCFMHLFRSICCYNFYELS
jgi:hypothetical protein